MLAFDTREQFLNSRKGKIGASDAPKIMEECPYSTPYKLWREKLGLDPIQEMKPHMQAGLDIEDEARMFFYKKTGISVNPYQIHHSTIPYMIASLDGISENGKEILEIKRPNITDHKFCKINGKPPKNYWIQIQHQLECTHLNYGYYLSFYENDPVLLTVERDQNFIETMLSKEAEFFNCMTQLIEPELTTRDFEKRDDDEWNFCSHNIKQHDEKIKELKNKLKIFEKEQEIYENQLILLARGKNSEGNGVKIRQVIRKGNIDYSLIPDLKHIDLEMYRKEPSKYWKINIGK